MISKPPMPSQAAGVHPPLAWPLALVHDNRGAVCGFLMPNVAQTWSLDRVFFPEHRARLQTSNNQPLGWHHLHEIARNLAAIVAACHDEGYVVGDLNNNNVRVYPDGHVCLIDTDSFQVIDDSRTPRVIYHCGVTFPEYTPPELLRRDLSTLERNPASDLYVLAILIYKLLQDGVHPFTAKTNENPPPDPSAIMQRGLFPYAPNAKGQTVPAPPGVPPFARLHPRLRTLFIETFTEGLTAYDRRPSARRWERALTGARNDLHKCARGHYFVAVENLPCLQMVSTKRETGYCGSTESKKSSHPLRIKEVDPVTGPTRGKTGSQASLKGTAHKAGRNAAKQPSSALPPTPPSPAGPPPPPPPSSSLQSSVSGGKRTRAYAAGAVVVVLLVLVIVGQFNGGAPRESTVVASRLQSPTTIPRKPTPRPSKAISTVPSQRPKPEATKKSSPTQSAPTTEDANENEQSDGVDATVALSQSGNKALLAVLSLVRHSDSIFYSSQTADGWNLTIAIPANGTQFSLQQNAPIDPAPALSHRGDRLAYLTKEQNGYVVHVLDLRSGSTGLLPLPAQIGVPSNLSWQSPDTSLLVTSTLGDEPRIHRLDVNSGDIKGFLDPWSANPSVSRNGEMVYVVPFENNPDDLGIVAADSGGNANGRPFVLYAVSNEDFPSVDPSGRLVAYSISEGEEEMHTLGISRHSDDDSFISVPIQDSFLSSTPVRTAWLDSDRIAIGICNESSCEIIVYSLSGPTRPPGLTITETTSLGNIVYRSS